MMMCISFKIYTLSIKIAAYIFKNLSNKQTEIFILEITCIIKRHDNIQYSNIEQRKCNYLTRRIYKL